MKEMSSSIQIMDTTIEDMPEILALQKLAYLSEAILLDDFSIPPLMQTLDNIRADFHQGVILKAIDTENGGDIIGSVRGYVNDNTLFVGKLMVHPDYQHQGIGTALLDAVESRYPADRYELFTSEKSVQNLRLYIKKGYQEYKREACNDHLDFVHLEKIKG